MGDIGGFHDCLLLIIEFAMAFYTPTIFISSLIKTFFQVDRFLPTSSNNFRNRLYVNANRRSNQAHDKLQVLRKQLIAKLMKQKDDTELHQDIMISQADLITMLKMTSKRTKFKLNGFTTLVGHYFSCLKRLYSTKSLKQQMAFEKGASRVEEVLDLKQLIATQTDLKIIKKVLFSKQQRRLIDLQRSRVITLDSSTIDTASSPTHDEN